MILLELSLFENWDLNLRQRKFFSIQITVVEPHSWCLNTKTLSSAKETSYQISALID